MTLADRIITRRLAAGIFVTIFALFSLLAITEVLNSWRFNHLAETRGLATAWYAVFTASVRWTIKTIGISVLIGAVIGMLTLQAQRELVVIRASGISPWRVILFPTIFVALFGALIAFGIEAMSTTANRDVNPTKPGQEGGIARGTDDYWLTQGGESGVYILHAQSSNAVGTELGTVSVFSEDGRTRIDADRASYDDGFWILENARGITEEGTEDLGDAPYRLATDSTQEELRLLIGSTEDFTFYELGTVLAQGGGDGAVRYAVETRWHRLMALPLQLVGSLLIAFAFTAGYRRTNKYGLAIVYAIILGFVIFLVSEMAERAGSAGVLEPVYAAWGPAIISTLIGVSILLRTEDGRA